MAIPVHVSVVDVFKGFSLFCTPDKIGKGLHENHAERYQPEIQKTQEDTLAASSVKGTGVRTLSFD